MKPMKLFNFFAVPEHMARFAKVSADQGQTMSALLRQLVTKENSRAAKEARATK